MAAAAAVLQQTLTTFKSRTPQSPQLQSPPITIRLSLSSNLKLPKITLKTHLRRRIGGAVAAKMADSAAPSYATALADVARSSNTLDQTYGDVEKLEKIFSDGQILSFFTNPTVDVEIKRNLIDDIARSSSLQPHVANFLNVLVDMGRIDIVKEIVREFELVYNRLTDTELAIVASVVRLQPQHLAQIAKNVQRLTGARNVRIKTVIDPSLVAGFTIRFGSSGSKLIDMSVKKQLEEIAAQLDLGDVQLAV